MVAVRVTGEIATGLLRKRRCTVSSNAYLLLQVWLCLRLLETICLEIWTV